MEEKQQSYRNIVKTTSLFGGVQVVQILSSIIRGKLVAVILGATGMGVNTILTSIINLMTQISTFGLNFSAVRDISQATETGDKTRMSSILVTFRRWIIFCALLGLVFTIALSSVISRISFGSGSYSLSIAVIAVAVFLTILGQGQTTILQGTRRYKNLAKSSLIGSFVGILTSVPIYYFLDEQGIVPALIIAAGTTFTVNWMYARKVEISPVEQTYRLSFIQGKEMAKLGIVLMISSLLGTLSIFLINSYVGHYGSLIDVGFYGAGTSITNQYLGVIFAAMAVDYFPRLSAVSSDRQKMNEMVNQQAEIVILICAPLIIGMMLTAPFLIRILLSAEFLVIREFICILAFGMIFKAASYALGYISFAKGDKRLFFWLEGIYGNSMNVILNIVGYYFWGLTGMALSFAVGFAIYFVLIVIVTRTRYQFKLNKAFIRIFLIALILTSLVFVQTLYFVNLWGYLFGILMLLTSGLYAYKELDKRIDLKNMLINKLKSRKDGCD